MITTTTPNIEGKNIEQYYGVVSAEVIIGANFFKDMLVVFVILSVAAAVLTKKVLDEARQNAMQELIQKAQAQAANAVPGIGPDFETVGANGSMLMVVATGTAVRIN